MSEHEDLVKRALRIARFDKLIVAIVVSAAAAVPFLPQILGAPYELPASVTLSLAVSFALIVLYGVQTLSSFMAGGPAPVLATLPLPRRDVSRVNLLCFVRTSDLLVVGSVACQVFLASYISGSAYSGFFMLLAGAANSAIAVSVALWLSSFFYKDIVGSERGKHGGPLRLVMLLVWGIAVLGIGVLFATAGYLIPLVQDVLASPSALTGSIVSSIYPFSLGVSVEAAAHITRLSEVERIAFVATAGYLLIAVAASKWSAGSVASLPDRASLSAGAGRSRDTGIVLRRPVAAYVMKDLRMASVNMPSAFLFALPAFETVVVLLYRASLPTLRASTLLVSAVLGSMFCLIIPLVLVSSEGTGFDFAKTLPLKMRTIVFSKALIATAVYLPAAAVMYGESLLKPLTSSASNLIPVASVMAVAAASLLEVRLFLGFAPRGRIMFALQDLARLAAGAGMVLLPATAYTAMYLLSFNHPAAAIVMLAAACAELFAAVEFVRRS